MRAARDSANARVEQLMIQDAADRKQHSEREEHLRQTLNDVRQQLHNAEQITEQVRQLCQWIECNQ